MTEIKKQIKYIFQASKLIYLASGRYFIWNFLLSIIISVLPYVPMFFWRSLLNILTTKNKDLHTVVFFVGCYCLSNFFSGLVNCTYKIVSYKYNDRVDFYIDNLLIDKISRADMSFFDSSEMADKLRNTSNYMRGTTKSIVMFLFYIIQSFLKIIVSVVIMVGLDFRILPFIVVLSIIPIVQQKKNKEEQYKFNKEQITRQRKMDYVKGLFFGDAKCELRLYDLKNFLFGKYENEWDEYYTQNKKLQTKVQTRECLSVCMEVGIEAIAILFSVAKLFSHVIGIGDVTYFISATNQFKRNLLGISNIYTRFAQECVQLDDIMEFVSYTPKTETGGSMVPDTNRIPSITFKNVSFRYPSSDTYVLKNCSFTVDPREKLGLVGNNGAGKSTIVKLLCRFYDPTEGVIEINGIDIREYDLFALRKLYGVLFQDYVRYSFTLRENIALSNIQKKDDDEKIYEAISRSHVSDFAPEWDNALETNLTRQFDKAGKELSGGQWQRVSLARAFFRGAPVVLLDEPSAALDPIAEYEIFEDFARISKDKSAVLISHRLSSITLCDKILVLSDGHITEQGTHRELLEKNGEYARLFNLQASRYM